MCVVVTPNAHTRLSCTTGVCVQHDDSRNFRYNNTFTGPKIDEMGHIVVLLKVDLRMGTSKWKVPPSFLFMT